MNESLTVLDGELTVLEDHPAYRRYRLVVGIDGDVATLDATALGPARNALYAQALSAVTNDVDLGALISGVQEGVDEDESLELYLATRSGIEGGGGPTGGFTLHMSVEYDQRDGDANRREEVLAAILAAVDANEARADLCVRERVIAGLVAHVADALALDVYRNPDRPVPLGALIAVEGGHRADYDAASRITYRTTVRLIALDEDETTAGTRAALALDALRSADRLGGIAVDVEEGPTEPDIADRAYAGDAAFVAVTALVTFATDARDPYAEAA